MRQFLLASALSLLCGVEGLAQNQPTSPAPVAPVPIPIGTPTIDQKWLVTHLEEEVETLEAHRDVKKAMVKAAVVGVRAAKLNLSAVTNLPPGTVSSHEVEKAKLDVEAAEAQLEIRLAEMKEVEVKIKYAKKRLDEAKAGPRPLKPVPPTTNPPKPESPPKIER